MDLPFVYTGSAEACKFLKGKQYRNLLQNLHSSV